MTSLFLLMGCTQQSKVDIVLSIQEIEPGEFTSTCDLVSSINGKTPSKVDELTLEVKGEKVTCSKNDFKQLGEHIVTFQYKGQKTNKKVVVVDKTAPIIHFSDKQFEVEEGNRYFDLLQQVSVTDNADSEPSLFMDGFYDLNTPGEYRVKLVAKDASANTTTQDIAVLVTEKKVVTIVEEKVIEVPINSGGNSSQKPSNPNTSTPSQSKPSGKKYSFTEGYDFDTGYQACVNAMIAANQKGYGARCVVNYEQNGSVAIGYELIID